MLSLKAVKKRLDGISKAYCEWQILEPRECKDVASLNNADKLVWTDLVNQTREKSLLIIAAPV